MAATITKREALDWTTQPADAHGECDKCHKDAKLWALPQTLDSEPDAHWLYCQTCFRALVTRAFRERTSVSPTD